MFASIRQQTTWDIDGDMLCGYYFHHPTAELLQEASLALQRCGYTFVSIFVPDAGGHTLHVERVEAHCVDSLHVRNRELEEFASTFGIESYDGMDVGLIAS
jgi:hypothetical protein